MWIRRAEFEKLRKRVDELESANFILRAPHEAKIGKVVSMILDHLKAEVRRSFEYDYLASKGGPEQPDR